MIYLNLGRREVGKTTLAYYIVHKQPTRVIFDPRGLFPGEQRKTQPEMIAAAFSARDPGEIVITPDTDVQECFDEACLQVKHRLRRGASIAFIVDECRFVPNLDSPDLNWILRCATRDSVSIVFTAHRPVDVTTDIRSISDMWCIFQMTQEHDLKLVAERCSPAAAQQVARLPPRHFIAWNDAAGKMSAHTHPERWYLPLRDTAALVEPARPMDDLRGDDIPMPPSLFDFTK